MKTGLTTDEVIVKTVTDRLRWRNALGVSTEDYEDLQDRANDAPREVSWAERTEWVTIVPNGAGECHPDWGTPNTIPTGEALRTVETVCRIISAL